MSRDGTAVCPLCGRVVGTFIHSEMGALLYGHRVAAAHTPETSWCDGGGREVKLLKTLAKMRRNGMRV